MVEDLKRMLLSKPFSPFRVTVKDGNHLDVTRPFQLAMGRTQFTYVSPKSERRVVLGLDQIVSLQGIGNTRTA